MNGSKLAATAANVSGVYVSTNSGSTWFLQTNGLLPYLGFNCVAASADGNTMITAAGASISNPIFISTNSGATWSRATNAPLARWSSVASSADGSRLLAAVSPQGNVYLSTNAGRIWAITSLPARNWSGVASSADGSKLTALANSGFPGMGIGTGGMFSSTNFGSTWVSNSIPSGPWTGTAMSADGNLLLATVGGSASLGGVYFSHEMPTPTLNLSLSSSALLSWIIPSLSFNLQQSSNLQSWIPTTNVPVLNVTNLQNQVALPTTIENRFFRLAR